MSAIINYFWPSQPTLPAQYNSDKQAFVAVINNLQQQIQALRNSQLEASLARNEDAAAFEGRIFSERQKREQLSRQLDLANNELQKLRQAEQQPGLSAEMVAALRAENQSLTTQLEQQRELVRALNAQLDAMTAKMQEVMAQNAEIIRRVRAGENLRFGLLFMDAFNMMVDNNSRPQ